LTGGRPRLRASGRGSNAVNVSATLLPFPSRDKRHSLTVLSHLTEEEGRKRIRLTDISRSRIGETVLFQARVHSSRALSTFDCLSFSISRCSQLTGFSLLPGAKLAFLVFRQQLVTVQGVLVAGATEEYGDASAEHNAPRESGGEAFVDAVKPLRQQGRERGISDEALEDRESSDEALDSGESGRRMTGDRGSGKVQTGC
jgi:hypothetical protein